MDNTHLNHIHIPAPNNEGKTTISAYIDPSVEHKRSANDIDFVFQAAFCDKEEAFFPCLIENCKLYQEMTENEELTYFSVTMLDSSMKKTLIFIDYEKTKEISLIQEEYMVKLDEVFDMYTELEEINEKINNKSAFIKTIGIEFIE